MLQMSLRRCRCMALLLVLSSTTLLYYLVTWSPRFPIREVQQPKTLHETQGHQVNTAPKGDLDTDDRGMYDEIELTEEDLLIAAEKRASLAKKSKFVSSFKQLQDKVHSSKKNVGSGIKVATTQTVIAKSSKVTTPLQKRLNVTSNNVKTKVPVKKVGRVTTTPRASINNPLNTHITLRNITASPAKLQGKKYGAEIIAEPSQIDPPVQQRATKRKAKVRHALVTPKIVRQLQHIHSVGQQLHDLHSYMQDDRIYYQYHKNKSRLSELSEKDQKLEVEREERILNANRDVRDITIPTSPPEYEHGYPIEFQSATYIPSGDNHDKTGRKHGHKTNGNQIQSSFVPPGQSYDTRGRNHGKNPNNVFDDDKSNLAHQIHSSGNVMNQGDVVITGDFNAVPNAAQLQYQGGNYDIVDMPQMNSGLVNMPHMNNGPVNIPQMNNGPVNIPQMNTDPVNIPQMNNGPVNIPQINNGPVNIPQMKNNPDIRYSSGNPVNIILESNDPNIAHISTDLNKGIDPSIKSGFIAASSLEAVKKPTTKVLPNKSVHQGNFPLQDQKKQMLYTDKTNIRHIPNSANNAQKENLLSQDKTKHQNRAKETTQLPVNVKTTPLAYEKLPHGDIIVHHAPLTTAKSHKEADSNKHIKNKMKNLNVTEDKVEDLDDKDTKKREDAIKLSKAFIMLLSNNSALNDTVATVSHSKQFERPSSVRRKNGLWQVHDYPRAMYLYSAYYDDRPALDRHKVRIIGIANAEVKNPHCLLWYEKQNSPDVAIAVLTKIGPRIQPTSSSPNRYEPYIFTCSVIRGKGPPKEVSMITIEETKPTTLLNIRIPVKPPPEKMFDIGQCMSVVYWHQDPTRLIEWLELNRIWGVKEITVYGNELDDATTAVFTDYAHQGLVDFCQMPNIIDDDSEFTILLNMSPAINDCMYRNMYRYKKVICTDVDEMIVPRTVMNYTQMMDQILAVKGSGHPHPSFMFRNVYFFTDFGPHVDEPWFLHSQRYLTHIKPSEFGYSVKSITDPQACIALQNHLCWKRIRKYDRKNWTIDVPLKFGRNQHYKTCHFDSYLGQLGACERMMKEYFIDRNIERFGGELYDRVAQKLLQFKIADTAPSP